MKLKLNKLKNDSQEIINNLQATVDSLIKIAFEYQTENEKLMAEIEQYKRNEKLIDAKCDSIQEKLLLLVNTQIPEAIKSAKSEAIKEFAERLKKEVTHIPAWGSVAEKKIDNLVKEMVGDE